MSACEHGERLFVAFEFEPRLAGGRQGQFASEVVPLRLDVFGTRELACQTQQIVLNSTETRTVNVELFLHRRARHSAGLPFCDASVGEERDFVEFGSTYARSAALIVNLYATTFTETGQRIWTALGAALLPVAVLRDFQRFSTQASRTFNIVLDREIDAKVQPSTPLVKGVIRVVEMRNELVRVRERRAGDIYHDHQLLNNATALMKAMIQRSQGVYFGPKAYMRASKPFLTPFHVPVDQTDFILLPSSAYAMVHVREPANVAYYEALLQTALRRSAIDDAEALGLARATRDGTGSMAQRAAFGALVVRMLCVFALSQCYMDDVVNLNSDGQATARADLICSSEDFKLCRLCGGDDCEGCALEPHMHTKQLCAADPTPMSELLRLVRSYLRAFVPCLALGCVTNKQWTIEQLDQQNAMAHTFAVLIPFTLFQRQLSAEQRGDVTDKSMFYADRRADIEAWRGIDERPWICEGTAPIDPAMRALSSYYQDDREAGELAAVAVNARRRFTEQAIFYLKRNSTQNRIGLEISGSVAYGQAAATTQSDQSTFYKYIVSLTTHAFVDRLRADFALVDTQTDASRRTFGVRFADFINGSAAVGIEPYLVYEPEEATVVDAVLADQQPIPNLVPAPAGNRAPLDDALAARLDELAKLKPLAAGGQRGDTALHRRQAYATARAIDFDAACISTIDVIVRSGAVRGFGWRAHTINAPIDGTSNSNWVLDFYFQF